MRVLKWPQTAMWHRARLAALPQWVQDPGALAQLQTRYAALKPAVAQPWTAAATLELGLLSRRAYGVLPASWRLQPAFCLPAPAVIQRLWGSRAAYDAAILAALLAEDGESDDA